MAKSSLDLPQPLAGITPAHWNVFGAVLLVAATSAVYFPAMRGSFLLDDHVLVTENEVIKDPGGLNRIWFTSDAIDYWPVTNTSLWIEWRLWGMHPLGYRITNLVLHLGTAALIWIALRQLSIGGAYPAALIFALHPVNVEAVAWIAQRKTLLATLLGAASVVCYLKADPPRPKDAAPIEDSLAPAGSWGWYAASLVAFLLGMLSKGSIATLPLLLLVIVWWHRGRVGIADLLRTGPFFLVGAGLAAVNVWFQTHGSGEVIRSAGLVERLLGAGLVPWFYLWKALFPAHLIFVYPQWSIQTNELRWWLPLWGSIATTVLLWLVRGRPWGRAMLFAWVFFCVALAPVMGFADVTFMKWSLVADHYQYGAIIAVIALVAAGWSLWFHRGGAVGQIAAAVVVVPVIIAAGMLTLRQCGMYRDGVALWRPVVEYNSDWFEGHNHYGMALDQANRLADARAQFEEALRLKPDFADAENNLGLAIFNADQPQQAIGHYREALRLDPKFAVAHYNLANALLSTGQIAEAIEHFEEAIRLQPDLLEARTNLAAALMSAGRPQEAFDQLNEVLRLIPDDVKALSNRGGALLNLGRKRDAIESYRQAVMLKPDFFEAQFNLGVTLLSENLAQEAVAHLKAATQIRTDYVPAWLNLAGSYSRLGQTAAAVDAAQQALQLARQQGQVEQAKQIDAWLNANKSQAENPVGPPTP